MRRVAGVVVIEQKQSTGRGSIVLYSVVAVSLEVSLLDDVEAL